jgi:ATP-dependent DNA helicase RecG
MITTEKLKDLITKGETIDVEFKSESRHQLSDKDIYEAIVCLSNKTGQNSSFLLIGIEDNGEISGAQSRYFPEQLAALIANNTDPPVSSEVSFHIIDEKKVICIRVEPSSTPVSTTSGRSLRRAIGSDGRPSCRPFRFPEMQSYLSTKGKLDYSSLIVEGATWDDLDQLEFERLRRMIRENRSGDKSLLDLSDVEIAKALGAVEANHEVKRIRALGLLLFGKEDALKKFIPTCEVAFQVLEHLKTRVNEFYKYPLIRVMETVLEKFDARNSFEELTDLFRTEIYDYPPAAFREGFANALIHRDYIENGAVHVQLHDDHLEISNPGGFPDGVRLDNILVVPPTPRNYLLADAFKRMGLVERTGRGIDTIFREQIINGRLAPSYERSTDSYVVLALRGGKANLDFVRLVIEENKSGRLLSTDELIVLNQIWFEGEITSQLASELIQKPAGDTRGTLKLLIEKGIIESKGSKRGKTYNLTSPIFAKFKKETSYLLQKGFDPIQQEQMILGYIEKYKKITRRDVVELCKIESHQAKRLLKCLCDRGKISMHGKNKATWYGRVD